MFSISDCSLMDMVGHCRFLGRRVIYHVENKLNKDRNENRDASEETLTVVQVRDNGLC